MKSGIIIMVSITIQNPLHKGVLYLNDNIKPANRQERADTLKQMAEKRRSNDKVIPWMRKHLSESALASMEHCGDYLVMLEDDTGEHRKLDYGFFCKQRLCSGCAWRSAVKSAQCISAIAQKMSDDGYIMIFVTLTVPNVAGDKLRKTIQHLGRSWLRLTKRKRYAVWTDGVRKIEITYNAKTDTYHPHMHMVLFVTPGYFARHYVSRAQLLKDWREVTEQPEITQVDIRRCRDLGATNAILEVAKYSAKASDYAHSEEVLDTFYKALHHTRMLTFFGRCRELREEYENDKLQQYAELDTVRYTMRVVYIWQRIADTTYAAAAADHAAQSMRPLAPRPYPKRIWAYAEHRREHYDMDAAELERMHRDEKRLAQYACEQAKRSSELSHLFASSWVREIERMDWHEIEVIE